MSVKVISSSVIVAPPDSDGDNIPDAADASTGNVIIVTATKREQTLQETPVSVSVTSRTGDAMYHTNESPKIHFR